jgi:hypothetical protein
MNMQQALKQMKSEDKAYGERQQKKSQQVKTKSKNQPNFAKMNVQDIMHMEDDEDDFELQY